MITLTNNFKKIFCFSLLLYSFNAFGQANLSDYNKSEDVCKNRVELTKSYFLALMLSLKLNNQKALDKILNKDCRSPNIKQNFFEHPIFNISSPSSFEKMKNAGADFSKSSRFGWDLYSTIFSYYIPLHKKTNYLTSVSKQDHSEILHSIPKGYITKQDFDNVDFSRLSTKEEFDDLLKLLIDKNPDRLDKLPESVKPRGVSLFRITPIHYSVYYGNYKIFNYMKNKLGDRYNPNVVNDRGQPLLALALNHYCSLESFDDLLNIIKDLLIDEKTNLDTVFKVNDSSEIKVKEEITYYDLLLYYKKYGDEKRYESILALFKKYRPDFIKGYDENIQSLAITNESLRTDLCLNIGTENENYFDQP